VRKSSYCFRLSHHNSVRPSVCLAVRPSHGWNEIGPRLLLITNREWYTGSRLATNSVTLNDLECQNRGFYGFFLAISGCDTSLYHSQGGATLLSLCRYAIQIENFVFVY